jgi:hypothetical protein
MGFVLLLIGCGTPWDEGVEGGLRVLRWDASTDTAGVVDVVVPVEPGETAMLLTASAPADRLLFVHSVRGPGGDARLDAKDFWELDTNQVNAAFSAPISSINWPYDASAPALEPGRWRVSVRADAAQVPVALSVVLKRDDDFSQGALTVNVLIAASLEQDPLLLPGIEDALAIWREEIYAPVGIDVVLQTSFVELPEQIEQPGVGDAELYTALAEASARGEVNLVVTDRVTANPLLLGISGGIPGPLVAARNAAVALSVASASEAAGRDRVFSSAEVELFAETMAHEVGHYLGLFHPAEMPITGFTPPAWDALADTPKCDPFEDCIATLGGNLMFPTPVCEDDEAFVCPSYLWQRTLSDLQVALTQRYTGVR